MFILAHTERRVDARNVMEEEEEEDIISKTLHGEKEKQASRQAGKRAVDSFKQVIAHS